MRCLYWLVLVTHGRLFPWLKKVRLQRRHGCSSCIEMCFGCVAHTGWFVSSRRVEWRSSGRWGALARRKNIADTLTDENEDIALVHQKLWNKVWEMRKEEIRSLEETRDQKMDHAHCNWWFTATVPWNCEAKFEQPGGARSVRFEGKRRWEAGV
jgi:hypothetical protein